MRYAYDCLPYCKHCKIAADQRKESPNCGSCDFKPPRKRSAYFDFFSLIDNQTNGNLSYTLDYLAITNIAEMCGFEINMTFLQMLNLFEHEVNKRINKSNGK